MGFDMAGWRLRLKGQQLLKMGKGTENPHQLHLRSGISYPTVKKYVDDPEGVRAYDSNVLPAILINGQGLSPQQVLDMRLGDLFDLVFENDAAK